MQNHHQQELWLTVYHWLKKSGNHPNRNFCREELTTHPDYPTLLSVIDFLDAGGMAYRAVRADSSNINEFNYPVLAHIKKTGQEYLHLVIGKETWVQEKDMSAHWSGVVVFPEENAVWNNADNKVSQKKADKNIALTILLSVAGLTVFTLSSLQLSNISLVAFGLLSLIGLIASLFVLGSELGFQSKIVKQVCGTISSGGCEKVLKSQFAKGKFGITPADMSVTYFSSQFAIYLLSAWFPFLLPILMVLAFAGIIVSGWSVYIQAIKLKQWCALCLVIVGVLVVQAAISLGYILPGGLPPIAGNGLMNGILLFVSIGLLFSFILLSIKQLLKKNNANQVKLSELKRWKYDADLFITLWQQEQAVDTTVWSHDLLLGNPAAPIMITVACNPYCGPCAKAHTELESMLHRYDGKISVLVRFLNTPEDADNPLTKAVTAILQKFATVKSNEVLQEALSDWFKMMNYQKWTEKWNPATGVDVGEKLRWHNQWTEQSNIVYTPTFFINGRKIPGRYSLEDISWLIPQLTEKVNEKNSITA